MNQETNNGDQLVHPVKVQVRRILAGDGSQQIDLSVYCPARGELPLEACQGCEFHGALEGPKGKQRVSCGHPEFERIAAFAPQPTAGDQTAVAAVMTRGVLCVRPGVSVDTVTRLMLDRGFSGVPVVNERGRPVGMISKTDLVRVEYHDGRTEEHIRRELGHGFHAEEPVMTTVGEIMTPLVLKVEATDTLSQAAALMASQRVHRVPVVSDGVVVGMLSAIDILRWLGEQDGYLFPER